MPYIESRSRIRNETAILLKSNIDAKNPNAVQKLSAEPSQLTDLPDKARFAVIEVDATRLPIYALHWTPASCSLDLSPVVLYGNRQMQLETRLKSPCDLPPADTTGCHRHNGRRYSGYRWHSITTAAQCNIRSCRSTGRFDAAENLRDLQPASQCECLARRVWAEHCRRTLLKPYTI
jgi:hypothetical protein